MDMYKCDTCGKEVNQMNSDKDYENFMTIKHWKDKGEVYPCFSMECKGHFDLVTSTKNKSR